MDTHVAIIVYKHVTKKKAKVFMLTLIFDVPSHVTETVFKRTHMTKAQIQLILGDMLIAKYTKEKCVHAHFYYVLTIRPYELGNEKQFKE
jgi:hypothetical protein